MAERVPGRGARPAELALLRRLLARALLSPARACHTPSRTWRWAAFAGHNSGRAEGMTSHTRYRTSPPQDSPNYSSHSACCLFTPSGTPGQGRRAHPRGQVAVWDDYGQESASGSVLASSCGKVLETPSSVTAITAECKSRKGYARPGGLVWRDLRPPHQRAALGLRLRSTS